MPSELDQLPIDELYGRLFVFRMGPNWNDLKRVHLLDARQREDEKKWDLEFMRRKEELKKEQQISSQRRTRNNAKLTEMSARWRSLEQKRVQKSDFYLERLRTNLSIALRQESFSPGSDR